MQAFSHTRLKVVVASSKVLHLASHMCALCACPLLPGQLWCARSPSHQVWCQHIWCPLNLGPPKPPWWPGHEKYPSSRCSRLLVIKLSTSYKRTGWQSVLGPPEATFVVAGTSVTFVVAEPFGYHAGAPANAVAACSPCVSFDTTGMPESGMWHMARKA